MSSKDSELKIVLIGKVRAGKTAFVDTLRSCSENNEKPASESHIPLTPETDKFQKTEVKIRNHRVVVVDTPSLRIDETEKVAENIKKYLSDSAFGPFVFVFVMEPDRFTEIEENMVKVFWKTFGELAEKYTLVLFTHGDILKAENQTIQEYMKDSEELKNFVSKCKGETFVIDNENPNLSEVTKLLQQIQDTVDKSGGKGYTCEKAKKLAGMKKEIALSVNGGVLVGAGVGAGATHLAGGALGIPGGIAVGAAVGGVVGFVGVVAAAHIKAKTCARQ